MFYAIIRMYCDSKEHTSSHFHAYYQDHKAMININTLELMEGNLPKKAT